MPDIIRSKSIGSLYSKKLPERARTFVRSTPIVDKFELRLRQTESEISMAIRRMYRDLSEEKSA